MLNGPLKPTPSKVHYLFNLRDISRVYGGVILADRKMVSQPLHLLRLWVHECMRVFGDRLIERGEVTWLQDFVVDRCQAKFAVSSKELFNTPRLIFGDFNEGIDVETRVYK